MGKKLSLKISNPELFDRVNASLADGGFATEKDTVSPTADCIIIEWESTALGLSPTAFENLLTSYPVLIILKDSPTEALQHTLSLPSVDYVLGDFNPADLIFRIDRLIAAHARIYKAFLAASINLASQEEHLKTGNGSPCEGLLTLNFFESILKNVGHESRTMLNSISGPVQIIRAVNLDPNLLEPLRIMEINSVKFEKYSYRTLLLSDLLRGDQKVKSQMFDLSDLVKHAVLNLSELLGFFKIKVEFFNDKTPVLVTSESDLFYQALQIFVEHAAAYCNEGTLIRATFINTQEPGIRFDCTDNGIICGIYEKVFLPSAYPADITPLLLRLIVEKLQIDFRFQKVGAHTTVYLNFNTGLA